MTDITKVIIDTDPGHDDAMALMLAILSPNIEVLGITTVCGNSTIVNSTRNARFILKFLNREDIPVFSGAKKPLNRKLIQAVVHGSSGLEGIDPTNPPKLTGGDAPERIIEIIKSTKAPITLAALGPLTNIAKAIMLDPITMSKLKEIVIMGGAISVPGNMTRVAEFNIFTDPEAMDIVLKHKVRKVLVPLDACNDVKLRINDLKELNNRQLRKTLEDMLRPYIANLSKDAGVAAAIMYDPSVVFYVLQPRSCEVKQEKILVETKGNITRGMLIVDHRLIPDALGDSVTVVMEINTEEFKKRFMDTLNNFKGSV